jgi:hypothetical protein
MPHQRLRKLTLTALGGVYGLHSSGFNSASWNAEKMWVELYSTRHRGVNILRLRSTLSSVLANTVTRAKQLGHVDIFRFPQVGATRVEHGCSNFPSARTTPQVR